MQSGLGLSEYSADPVAESPQRVQSERAADRLLGADLTADRVLGDDRTAGRMLCADGC